MKAVNTSCCHTASPLVVAMFYLFIHILILLDGAGIILYKLMH